jgi:uncharacterized protein
LTQDSSPNPELKTESLEEKARPRGIWRLFAVFRKILQIDDTPESIAKGVALGIFIAMTPTVGLQMILVVIVHSFAKANRMAGIVMCYLSNPATMLPIYWADYQVGRLLLGQPAIPRETFNKIFALEGPNLLMQLKSFVENLMEFSWDVAGPLFLGGMIMGFFCGMPAYPVTLKIIRRHRERKLGGGTAEEKPKDEE